MKKYLIKTDRVGLRPWKSADIVGYYELNKNPNVLKFFPKEFWPDRKKCEKDIIRFMDHYEKYGFTYFAADYLQNDQFLGFIGMKTVSFDAFFTPAVDIGWRIKEEFWGLGLATEGANAAKDYFFNEFDYDRLVSMTPVQNVASWRVMEKIGMIRDSEFNHPLIKFVDEHSRHYLYTIEK